MPYLILGLILFTLGKRVVDKKHAAKRTEGRKQETANPTPDVEAALVASESVSSIEIGTSLDRQEKPKNQQGNSSQSDNKWIMRFTGLIFIATLIYAIVSGLQWRESIRTREIENRAYLGVNGATLKATVASGELPVVIVTSQNVGKTPARNCVFTPYMSFSNSDNPPPDAVYPNTPKPLYVLDMLPGQSSPAEVAMGKNLTAEEREKMVANGLSLHVWGVIEYDDVFGHHWITTFCLKNIAYDNLSFKGCSWGNTFQ